MLCRPHAGCAAVRTAPRCVPRRAAARARGAAWACAGLGASLAPECAAVRPGASGTLRRYGALTLTLRWPRPPRRAQAAPHGDSAEEAPPAQLARRDALALAAAALASAAAAPADAAGIELGLRRIGRSAKFDSISPDAYKTLPSGLKYYDVVVR